MKTTTTTKFKIQNYRVVSERIYECDAVSIEYFIPPENQLSIADCKIGQKNQILIGIKSNIFNFRSVPFRSL